MCLYCHSPDMHPGRRYPCPPTLITGNLLARARAPRTWPEIRRGAGPLVIHPARAFTGNGCSRTAGSRSTLGYPWQLVQRGRWGRAVDWRAAGRRDDPIAGDRRPDRTARTPRFADQMEPALTGGTTSPPLSAAIVSAGGSVIPEGAGWCQVGSGLQVRGRAALAGHGGMASRLDSPDWRRSVRAGRRVRDRAVAWPRSGAAGVLDAPSGEPIMAGPGEGPQGCGVMRLCGYGRPIVPLCGVAGPLAAVIPS